MSQASSRLRMLYTRKIKAALASSVRESTILPTTKFQQSRDAGNLHERISPRAVYVLDPYHEDAIALLQRTPGISLILHNDPRKKDWHKHAEGAILRSDTLLTAADFAKASKLLVVVKQGVGVDNIDLAGAKAHNVALYNTPGINSEAVAEFCLATTLSLSRRICEMDRSIRAGKKIIRSQMLGMSLFQKTIGVVGMGNIGKVTARKWIGAMDCRIIGYDPFMPANVWADIPHERAQSLEELLTAADVVTLQVPLTPSTKGLIVCTLPVGALAYSLGK